jgi:hypothetical protein
MGYMRHNAIIVFASSYVMEREGAPDVDAFRRSLPEEWRRLVVGPVMTVVNGDYSFAFLPDGSKEGWPDSDRGDEYRRQFLGLFSFAYDDGSSPFDVLVVNARFGGDEPGAGYEPELVATVTVDPHVPAEGRPGRTVVMTTAAPAPSVAIGPA